MSSRAKYLEALADLLIAGLEDPDIREEYLRDLEADAEKRRTAVRPAVATPTDDK